MSDLTDADLEAMGERCEAVRTEAVRENSPWNPWFMGQAEILATDLSALIAALREARGERDGFKAENRLLVACLNSIRCLAVEGIGAEWEGLAPKVVSIYATCVGPELVPLTAAEVERVKRLEAESEAARAFRNEYRKDFGAWKDLRDDLFQLLDKHDEAAALAELDAGEGPC